MQHENSIYFIDIIIIRVHVQSNNSHQVNTIFNNYHTHIWIMKCVSLGIGQKVNTTYDYSDLGRTASSSVSSSSVKGSSSSSTSDNIESSES